MRLVIDCFKLIKGTGKSIGIYNVALGIVRHMGEMNTAINKDTHSENNTESVEILVLGNKENREDFDVPGIKFVEIKKFNPKNKTQILMWELFYVSKVCKKLKADRVFFPRGYAALTHPVYDIVLIHDLIPFYYNENFPGVFNKAENAYIMKRLKKSARSAKKIITISQASKADIIKYCDVDEKKIVVINNACKEIDLEINKADNSYICAMTSELPHKNAKGVIESYIEYCKMAENPLKLVVIGLQDTSGFDISEKIRKNITCYKFIKSDEDMYKIIGASEVFLFLSLIEGFGLPPVEAMQLGVPVICSNTSSLPEVVNNSAVLVNPSDCNDVAKKIHDLCTSVEMRESLISSGKENIKRFSWDIIAKLYWKTLMN